MRLTPEQEAIIQAQKGNVLVSAAAGSGKTAVLTERIVRRVVAQELDVQRVLVVTFTDAAARQMRQKIEEKLQDALHYDEEDNLKQYLSRQLALLPSASICTIHAFCLQVVQNFYHLACDEKGRPLIEPGFTVLDSIEADLLLRQVLDDWMNSQYEAIDLQLGADKPDWTEKVQAFYRLTDGYGNSRSDQPVRELMLRLFYFLRSIPNYTQFARDQLLKAAQAAADFSGSQACRILIDQLRIRMDRAFIAVPTLQAMLMQPIRLLADKKRNEEAIKQLQEALFILTELQSLLKQNDVKWDQIYQMTRPLEQLELPRRSGRDPVEKKIFLDLFSQYVAEAVCFLSGQCGTPTYRQHFLFQTNLVFDQAEAEIESEIKEMLPAVSLFIDLVIGLDAEYKEKKRAAGVIDFSDFEHLALTILCQDEARRYYRERFNEIYVDEYQDTSSIQEAILQAISQDKTVMVGDIKQSIYRFRHARPQIFQDKAIAYDRQEGGRLMLLNRNFRSVFGLIDAVNDVFSQLMSIGAGEIIYDHRQGLVPFRDDQEEKKPVQVLLLDLQNNESITNENEEEPMLRPDEMSRYEKEALIVLPELLRMREAGYAWRDMVILARTRAILSAYCEQLEAAGIPTAMETAMAVMDTPVLRLLEALLMLLDNRRQDIPLAAVLHGGIGPDTFTLEELAQIRLYGRQRSLEFYHEAVFAYAQEGPDEGLRKRLGEFLLWLDDLREKEQVLRIGELIGLIYSETGWLDRVAAELGGAEQVRLLRQFQTFAEQYERKKPKGLYRFVRYLENLRAREIGEAPIEPPAMDENRVRLMTIHGSKGLEFPVVFLVGTSSQIGGKSENDAILFNENLGIGFDYADPALQIRYPTHLKLAMQEDMRAAELSEELRLLYVAMTRAKDRLFLVGTVSINPEKGAGRILAQMQLSQNVEERLLPDHLVRSARSYLEWILLSLSRNPWLDLSFLSGSTEENHASADRQNANEIEQKREEDEAESAMPGMKSPSKAWSVTCRTLDLVCEEAEVLLREAPNQVEEKSEEAATPDRLWLEFNDENFLKELEQRVILPYRFSKAAQLPIKLTVSELKRHQMPDDPDELAGVAFQDSSPAQDPRYRGIDLTLKRPGEAVREKDITGIRLGTLLHAVFRYLDLISARMRPVRFEIERQLHAMEEAGMLSSDEKAAVLPFVPAILQFVQSELAEDLAAAMKRGEAQQEMPFTLSLPACEIYKDQNGLSPDDQVMIQGMIDCWFYDQNGITLIDYKSDAISGSTAFLTDLLTARYSEQMRWYKRAIQVVTGRFPDRCLIWHIPRGLAIPF